MKPLLESDGPFCGTCRHWWDRGVNPQDLRAGRQGECREQVHVIAVPQSGMSGRVELSLMATYAAIPERFPACSRYAARLEVRHPNG